MNRPPAVVRARGYGVGAMLKGGAAAAVPGTEDVAEALRAATGGRGARIVLDVRAGPDRPHRAAAFVTAGPRSGIFRPVVSRTFAPERSPRPTATWSRASGSARSS